MNRNYQLILLICIGFVAATILNFLNIATSQTIASYKVEDFEIGQIADRTIYAPKSIPADDMNPVFIEEGEKIIRKGFPITEEAFSKLKKMSESPIYLDFRAFANLELYSLLILSMWYLFFAFISFGRKLQVREFVYQVVCFLLVYAAAAYGYKTQYFTTPYSVAIVIPASLFILIEAVLYGQLSAVFYSFLLSFGVFGACGFEVVPFLFTLCSCLAASSIVRKIEKRIDLVMVAFVMAIFNTVIIVILSVIFNERLQTLPTIVAGVAANGFLSGILALGFITPVEFLLNTASVFRMMDLSDLNNPIMRKMLVTASGTYQHSQMVAQLAENACREIGANALLARVGGYYHDIGKMDQSEYFMENQVGGINKHDEINNPRLSASIIRSHVRKGVEKAHQLHLPQAVIDIITEHHGNSVIALFYEAAKKNDPNVDIKDFSYQGVPPRSRESGVVMLADTVDAATKSMENPTEERLDKFIKSLINLKAENGQLDDCDLTFQELTKIRHVFVNILVGYHHTRVKYPNQKDPDDESVKGEKTIEAELKKDRKTRKKGKDEDKTSLKKSKDVELGDKTLNEVRLNGQ